MNFDVLFHPPLRNHHILDEVFSIWILRRIELTQIANPTLDEISAKPKIFSRTKRLASCV